MKLISTLAGLLALVPFVSAMPACDPEYECEFFAMDTSSNKLYRFDVGPLCNPNTDYTWTGPNTGFHYSFQICGQTHAYCLPKNYQLPYTRGLAIQFLSSGPAPSGTCSTPYNESAPCTNDCEVLAHGQPIFDLVDESNPETGGFTLKHFGEPPLPGDQHECPFSNQFGGYYPRNVVYNFICGEPTSQGSPLTVTGFRESPQCTYNFDIVSKAGCGQFYSDMGTKNGSSKKSSHAGLGAGMFFFGMIMAAIGLAGFIYWHRRRSGNYSSFGNSGAAASESTSAFGASAGSASYATVGK